MNLILVTLEGAASRSGWQDRMVSSIDFFQSHEHEQLGMFFDPATNMRVLIAIHNTRLGPAIGGTRLKMYSGLEPAIQDVLHLSEAMTYKAALVGLSMGGGKAVIPYDAQSHASWLNPNVRAARLQLYGRIVESLHGRFITAEDVGTTPADMMQVKQTTQYVAGVPMAQKGSGDPARITALGVVQGIKAAAEEILKTDTLTNVRIAVQGLGNVGRQLVALLRKEGAIVIGADISPEAAHRTQRALGITVVDPEEIFNVSCDIFAPCAYGGALNDKTIPRLKCKIVAGCANNPLEEDRHGRALHELGIFYVVDYIINAGGLINVAQELEPDGYREARVLEKVEGIYHTTKKLLARAQDESISTLSAAREMALEVINTRASSHPPLPTTKNHKDSSRRTNRGRSRKVEAKHTLQSSLS